MRKWSVDARKLVNKVAVGEGALAPGMAVPTLLPGIGAVDWASGGSFVVCGLSSGDIVIVSPSDMAVLSR